MYLMPVQDPFYLHKQLSQLDSISRNGEYSIQQMATLSKGIANLWLCKDSLEAQTENSL